jgi:tetratricopeptide (TPR) repeat protein
LLSEELSRRHKTIVVETTRSQTTGSPQAAVNALSGPVAELAQMYYAKPEDVDVSALRQAWEAVRTQSEQHGIRVPPATTLMAAATWMSKATTLRARPDDRKTALTAALELYEHALSTLNQNKDPERWASAQYGIGYMNNEMSLWGDYAKRNQKAIAAYEQALKVSTIDRFPVDFAKTQNNLGNAYNNLA